MSLIKETILGAILLVGITGLAAYPADKETALFSGRIVDENAQPLWNANIVLKGTAIGGVSNKDGYFSISAAPDSYTVIISYMGYETIKEQIRLVPDTTLYKLYELVMTYFEIGGIVVIAERELLPSDATTTTRISSGEIEHIQASSLSDVLKLVPGQRFDNPGLQEMKQFSIRTSETEGAADRNAFMGTQIIVDDVPVSNNANMQIDTKVNTADIQRTSENSGIDLRQLPADNIQEVVVIRGIPSAKYGDLTSGIVQVKTRSENVPHRVKLKHNLQNMEINLGGGIRPGNTTINYNINFANSVRDIRIPDFGYSRLYGLVSLTNNLFQNIYTLSNKLYFTRTFDEQGLRDGDLLFSERYNRDYILRYTHKSELLISPVQKLDIIFSYNYNRQNSFKKRLISIDNTYISDRMTEGTSEGEYVQNYISELWVKGRARNTFFSTEYHHTFILSGIEHELITGLTYRRESNDGPGRSFDPMYPPSVTSVLRDRPRPYDDIPALDLLSFYFEDELKGRLGLRYLLRLGVRSEIYQPKELKLGADLFKSRYGSFLNPRMNLVIYGGENTQLRVGYGLTSKAPPLSMLYPNLLYYDLDDINRYTTDEAGRLVVVSTYIFSKRNLNLKGYQQEKREISLDQRIGPVGLTITGYSSATMGGFASTKVVPLVLQRHDYPNWMPGAPDTSGKTIKDTVYNTYSIVENSQQSKSNGVELSIQTKRFSQLSMRLRLDLAYNYTHSWNDGYDYASSFRYEPDLKAYVKPFWNPESRWVDNLIANYRLEFTVKELGAWVTLEAQQIVFDRDKYVGLNDSLPKGYISHLGEVITIEESARGDSIYSGFRRVHPDWWHNVENKRNTWLFNLRVSKSLFEGFEVSFFVNNIFNAHPLYERRRSPGTTQSYTRLNPNLYFGVEYSGIIDGLFQR